MDPVPGRVPGVEVFLQIGLVPDLPGLDRQRRGARSVLLPVAVGPVAAAPSVARHRRLEEVLPRLLGKRAVDRGTRRARAHPLRRSPHEWDRPDSARGKAADDPVRLASNRRRPGLGCTRLHWSRKRLVRTRAAAIPWRSLLIQLSSLGDAEVLGSGGFGRGRSEQRQDEPGEDDREVAHSRSLLLHPRHSHREDRLTGVTGSRAAAAAAWPAGAIRITHLRGDPLVE